MRITKIGLILLVSASVTMKAQAGAKKDLVKEERHLADVMEIQPLVYQGRQLLLTGPRPGGPNWGACHPDWGTVHLDILEVASNKCIATFAKGYSMPCAIIHNGEFFVYTLGEPRGRDIGVSVS